MADPNNSTPATPTITTSYTDSPIPLVALTSGQLPLKLTHLTYPSWRAQFNSLLFGYDLHDFIDGTLLCPDQTSVTFSLWMRQDQLLLHAIRIFVSDSIAPLIASVTASKKAWDKLNRLYASRSRSRVMSLKERLVRPRGSCSLTEYLRYIKTIVDELALIELLFLMMISLLPSLIELVMTSKNLQQVFVLGNTPSLMKNFMIN